MADQMPFQEHRVTAPDQVLQSGVADTSLGHATEPFIIKGTERECRLQRIPQVPKQVNPSHYPTGLGRKMPQHVRDELQLQSCLLFKGGPVRRDDGQKRMDRVLVGRPRGIWGFSGASFACD